MSQKSIVTIMKPLEKALAHAGDYEEEWKRAMIAMFKALALTARSGHHLEQLHASLPENCRLVREDFLLIKEIVAQLLPKGAKADYAPPDDAILDMLASIRGEALMREYYEFVLSHRSFGDRVMDRDFYFDPSGILDSKPELKREIACLWWRDSAEGNVSNLPEHETQWEGRHVLLEFACLRDPLKIEVEILFMEPNLTEPFVHKVRTTFARNAACTLVPGEPDLRMRYSFFTDAKSLMRLTERADEQDGLKRGPLSVTTKAFLDEIRKRFAADGIAFGEIQPRKRTKGIFERLHEMPRPSSCAQATSDKKSPRSRKNRTRQDTSKGNIKPPSIIVE